MISIRLVTDVSVLSSWDGTSRRRRKRFSGTGGISSGRTTGFSLFPLCSFSPSRISLFSGLWESLGHHKRVICYAEKPVSLSVTVLNVCFWIQIKQTSVWGAAHSPSLTPFFSFWTVCSFVSCVCDACAFPLIRFHLLPKRTEMTRGNWGTSEQNGRFVFSCLGVLK